VNKPIGIFDSGIGGLTVLSEIERELPGERFVYFGDTARVPYGTKSRETVTRFSIENTLFLQTLDVKLVVVACHTASSLALATLAERFSIPLVGMIEPGARKAAQLTKTGRIGVIGTKATISSGAYEQALKRIDPALKVFSTACPLFVPLVEEGWSKGDVAEAVARFYLEPLKAFDIDTLILGCTHYPLLAGLIGEIMSQVVTIVNPARETAEETRAALSRLGLSARQAPTEEKCRFFVSDEPEHFRQLGEKFFGRPIGSVVKVSLDSLNTPIQT
jgi:glutamate racemase